MNNKDFSDNSTYQKKPHALLVSEKPSVSVEIQKAYNKIKDTYKYEIDFTSAAGHLLSLFEPGDYKNEWGTPWTKDVLPIIPDTFKTKVTNHKFYDEIKKLWDENNYDIVINAGDAGREGQLIQELIYRSIGVNVPVLRFWADDTTEKTIIKTLNNLRPNEEFKGLTDASFLRLYFDWLLGINSSRATSLSLDRPASIGRVMTPTLAMIVNREKTIKSFTPVPYFELEATFNKDADFKGSLLNPTPEKELNSIYGFLDRKYVEDVLKSMGEEGEVVKIEAKEKTNNAPYLYNLSDLQKDMSNRYHYTPAVTLEIAQGLYEKKFLSYPRTESKCMSSSQAGEMKGLLKKLTALDEFKDIIEGVLNNEELIKKALSSKKYVDDKKVKDHPALLVTDEIPNYDELSTKEKNVYKAVLFRLLSIFMPANIVISTVADIIVGSYTFRATGNVTKEKGWKALFSDDDKSSPLPSLNEGDKVNVKGKEIKDKETSPPKRYTNATILTAMETAGKQIEDEELEKILNECAGLGTPATRAEILNKLEKKEYIDVSSKGIITPTDQGIQLIDSLNGNEIVSPELTAMWEQKLKQVEEGKLSYDLFYKAMIAYVGKKTKELCSLEKIGAYYKVIGKCPMCKDRDFLSVGTYYCCKGFLEKKEDGTRVCGFALPSKFGGYKDDSGKVKDATPLSETDIKALISFLPTKPKKFTWNNKSTSEASLILTPEGKISFPKPESIGKCPVCGGEVFRGKKGGYYCKNTTKKECDFLLYPYLGKTHITDEQVSEILRDGETKKEVRITKKDGEKAKFPSKIVIENSDEYGWHLALKKFKEEEVCGCPRCTGGKLIKKLYNYECTNYGKECDLRVSRFYFETEITPSDIKKLLNKQDIEKNVVMTKDGERKSFKSTLYLNKNEQGFYNIYYRKKNK